MSHRVATFPLSAPPLIVASGPKTETFFWEFSPRRSAIRTPGAARGSSTDTCCWYQYLKPSRLPLGSVSVRRRRTKDPKLKPVEKSLTGTMSVLSVQIY